MEYNLPLPDVTYRRTIHRKPTRGDVVAFGKETLFGLRTGILVMESEGLSLASVNLYDEADYIWGGEYLPDDIALYEASEDEKEWGQRYFFEHEYVNACSDKNIVVAFVEGEIPEVLEKNEWYRKKFCFDVLASLPRWGYIANDDGFIGEVWNEAVRGANTGLAFSPLRAELYCFVIAVMMINQHCDKPFCEQYIQQLHEEWCHFSWMYAMVIGRIIGTDLKTFTSMVNVLDNTKRAPYIHLYLSLIESNIDKICKYSSIEKKHKLVAAINKMKVTEERIEQSDNLDHLFSILFPKHFRKMMNESRPASTIKEMKEELAKKDEQITHWKKAAEDLTEQVNQLTEGMKMRVEESLSMEDVSTAILAMTLDIAKIVFSNLDFKLRKNEVWRKGRDLLLDKLEEKEMTLNGTSVGTNNGIVAGGNLNTNVHFTNEQVQMLINQLSLTGEQSSKLLNFTNNGNNNSR